MSKNIREININQIKIHDPFWSAMQHRMTDTVIPFQEKVLNDEVPGVEKSHAIENFRIAAGLSEGEFYGMVFQDSDVAKWLEGVAYSLAVKPDNELEARADEIIDIIEKAQQPDGYLDTFFIVKEPEHRWQNLQECHELYCAGHMMEAGVAYYQTTGKEKYKKMARYFLEERGKNPNYFYEEKKKRGWQHWGQYSLEPLDQRYTQTHATIYEQKEAVGHSVRAVYMYTAMADLAGEDKDQRLYEACQTLWDNIVKKRMYITGGIGSTVEGEAFTIDYDLPNDMAYAETCASIGMIFFAKRMLEIRPLGIYADIMEREFYNGTISGIQLDGKQFFYVNPLETNPGTSGTIFGYKHVLPTRPGWYACACCPPNLVRLVTSLGTYAWSESDTTLYSHLFLGQTADFEKAVVKVDSSYPWEGKVTYQVKAKMKDAFELAIHIPSHIRMDTLCVTVNGEKTDAASRIKDGYLYLKQNWGENDVVALTFDLPVRKIYANTNVREDEGCVALMRGPVVYCFEGADNGECIQALRIPREIKAETELCKEGVLAGNVLIHLPGYRMESSDALYSEERPKRTDVMLTAIPYYAWANRGENQMRVWMPEE